MRLEPVTGKDHDDYGCSDFGRAVGNIVALQDALHPERKMEQDLYVAEGSVLKVMHHMFKV
jgi:hypothetical protein